MIYQTYTKTDQNVNMGSKIYPYVCQLIPETDPNLTRFEGVSGCQDRLYPRCTSPVVLLEPSPDITWLRDINLGTVSRCWRGIPCIRVKLYIYGVFFVILTHHDKKEELKMRMAF
jgi:hypothetical protein